MGWATLTLRKTMLKQKINDNNLEQLQLNSQLNKLTSFSSAIGNGGTISPSQIASLGTALFGDALDYMASSDEMAREIAQQQTDYYTQTYEGITAQQYATSGLATQASLYFDENGSLDYEAIFQKFYEQNLKEYAEEFMPVLNEKQKEIETKLTELSTLAQSYEQELQSVNESISTQIQQSAIKLG